MAAAIQLPTPPVPEALHGVERTSPFPRRGERSGRLSLLPCLLAAGGIALCAWISFLLGQNSGSVACFYLVTVVLTAYYGGFWQATLISVAAVACLDYFFDAPIFSFTVNRPSDWVELGAFEFTALVISHLSNRVRLRELEIAAERRDASRLYQTARRILLFENPGDPGDQIAELIRDIFELTCVVVFDAVSGKTYRSGDSGPSNVVILTRDAYDGESDTHETDNRYCVLRVGARRMGSVALCGANVTGIAASALSSLVAIALERARSIEQQYHAEAAREAEQLRAAVLDSLAHKFKTPMTVIRTAIAGVPAAGELSQLQTELVSLVDQEARRLNDLACRLLETPALESGEFEPQREPLLLSRLTRVVIGELEQQADRDRFEFSISPTEVPVIADRELIMTAISQLADNAVKYSTPGTPIGVILASVDNAMVLSIRSRGLEVLPCDRQRIFDRFYRAPGAQQYANGTGLGLSIVRTIAADHQGKAWADGEPGYGAVFSLSLPALQEPPA